MMSGKRIALAASAGLMGAVALAGVAVLAEIAAFSSRFEEGPADAAVVLGAAVFDAAPSPVFEERIRHGVALYKAGKVRMLVMTGGLGPGDRATEAEAARRWSLAQGGAAGGHRGGDALAHHPGEPGLRPADPGAARTQDGAAGERSAAHAPVGVHRPAARDRGRAFAHAHHPLHRLAELDLVPRGRGLLPGALPGIRALLKRRSKGFQGDSKVISGGFQGRSKNGPRAFQGRSNGMSGAFQG